MKCRQNSPIDREMPRPRKSWGWRENPENERCLLSARRHDKSTPGTSKSTVSRLWAREGEKVLSTIRSRAIDRPDWLVLMLDGVVLESDLVANDQVSDKVIAETLGMHRRGIEELRRRFVEEGFEATLHGKPRGHRQRSLTGEDEARLIALACEKTPDGVHHWALRLLQERWATLENTDTKTMSHETIRKVLKKRTQALAKAGVVYPAGSQRGIRSADGGCAGCV